MNTYLQVLEIPVKLSTSLMTKMRSHGSGAATFREVQQLHGRHITHRQFGQLFNDLGDEEECGRRVNGLDPVADFCVLECKHHMYKCYYPARAVGSGAVGVVGSWVVIVLVDLIGFN